VTQSGGARVVSVSSLGHHFSDIRRDDVHWRQGYDKGSGPLLVYRGGGENLC
jgi:hypothetical protein